MLPSGRQSEPRSVGSSAVARNVSARRLDLMSVAWARTARVCRGTVPLSSLLELWDVQRFKELPPRPGFVCLLGVRLPFLARTAGQSSSLLPALHVCECADFIFIILTFLSSVFKTIAWNCCDLVWQM